MPLFKQLTERLIRGDSCCCAVTVILSHAHTHLLISLNYLRHLRNDFYMQVIYLLLNVHPIPARKKRDTSLTTACILLVVLGSRHEVNHFS